MERISDTNGLTSDFLNTKLSRNFRNINFKLSYITEYREKFAEYAAGLYDYIDNELDIEKSTEIPNYNYIETISESMVNYRAVSFNSFNRRCRKISNYNGGII